MSLFSPFSILNIDSFKPVDGATLSVDEGLSNLVTSILPDYVVSDHPTFVAFVKAYFEFLEKEGNSRFAAATLEKNVDVDQTLDSFIDFFKQQYLHEFPKNLESGIDDRFLIKKIKGYYQEKGNPRSLDLLFRILFGVSSDVEFPREKILSLSDAKADTRPKIVLTNYQGIKNFVKNESYQIKQSVLEDPTTGLRASAFLDDVRVVNTNGTDFVHADLVEVQGVFSPSVPVQIFGSTGDAKFENIVPLFSDIIVEGGGSGYSRNDTVVIKNSSNRIVETAKVKTVSNTGAITKIEKINQVVPVVGNYTVSVESNGSGATLSLGNQVATITKPRVYTSQKNIISSDSYIQDNYKYQQFSYVIKAEKSLFEYTDLIKKLFHPAGLKFFGQYNFSREFSLGTVTADSVAGITGNVAVRPVIGHYFPYTVSSTADFRGETYGFTFGDYYPTGYNGLTVANIGFFDSDGNAITHDPFDGGNFVTGPLGGNTGGTFNPDFYSTGITKLGYEPLTNIQLRMKSSDGITAPFFNIYKHPKNMEITDTLFPSDESQYENSAIQNDIVELYFDALYDTETSPHTFTGFPAVGDIAVQRTKVFEIGNIPLEFSPPRIQAFGTVLSVDLLPTTDSRYTDTSRAAPQAGQLAFKCQVRVHEGQFLNIKYGKRFGKLNEDAQKAAFVEFTGVNILGTRTLRGKRFISNYFQKSDVIKNLGTTINPFAFNDIKVGDFLERMRFTTLGFSGTTADNGITFPNV